MITLGKKFKTNKRELDDDSYLSKNHSKSVRFRLRVQEEAEAEEEIKDYQDYEDQDDYNKGT
jgi:hypothetical protein